MKLVQARRGMPCVLLAMVGCVGLSVLSGCASTGRWGEGASSTQRQERVADRLASADKASKAGQPEQALQQLERAIELDPANKQAWLKKAQIHFDARQYGLAITDAQEVIQRDAHDVTAKSILAVSGLRVSAQALEQLRRANEVSGSTRSEAESVAKVIREALGEPILSGGNGGESAARVRPRTAAPRVAPPPSGTPLPTAARAAANAPGALMPLPAAPSAAATAAIGGRSNPFGALQ